MNTTLEQTVSETEAHAMRRLLAKARDEGIRLGRDARGNYWASSNSRPGHWYEVTGLSCTCPGFQGHQRCKHLAALHAHLGWISDEAPVDPTPVASTVVDLRHTPASWIEDDLVPGGHLRWVPERTSILVDGIELVRISGDVGPTVVVNPGPRGEEHTDRHAGRSHSDEVCHWIRLIAPAANLDHLLGKADLWRSNECLEETTALVA